MKKICLILMICGGLIATSSVVASAQTKVDREQWKTEIRQYKRSYLTKELELTQEQQDKFFPLYEEMEIQTATIEEEARLMEMRVAGADDATDLEYEKSAEATYDAQVRSAELEKEYAEKFKDILTKKQLFQLKSAERQFAREMMRQYNRIRNARQAEAK